MLTQLRMIASDLNEVGAQWALVGALAVSVHTEPRTTRDIDIAVSVDSPHSHERLLQALLRKGYRNRQALMHLAPTHRLGDRLEILLEGHSPLALDLLFSSSGIEQEVVAAAEAIEIVPSVIIPVACPGHLIAMKVLSQNSSDRIRDRLDLQNLLFKATAVDIKIAREAVEQMSHRGFSRGKNLMEELSQSIAAFAPHLHERDP